MQRALRIAVALALCAGALAVAEPAEPAEASLSKAERRLVERINDARAAHGVRRLRVSGALQRGAGAWSRHLRRADSFHHAQLRSGTGEVLAWGTCPWFKPGRAVRMWLRSGSHRALLLKRSFRSVGVGWSRGAWRGYRCSEMAVARFR